MKLSNIFSKKNRILLRELVKTDFKLRYQGSVLGYLWSLLKPLMLFAILYVVFAVILNLGKGIEHYPIYLLLGTVIWTFFTEATSQGMSAIVSNGGLIRKINFPKYIIVIADTISALINFALNLLVIFIFMIINEIVPTWSFMLLPIIVIELYVFSLAIAFFLSGVYVKFRDMSHIWEIVMQAAFYATPILYPVTTITSVSPLIAKIIMMNPIAQIVQDARYSIVTHQSVTAFSLIHNQLIAMIPYLIVILSIIISSLYFHKHQKYFAENI